MLSLVNIFIKEVYLNNNSMTKNNLKACLDNYNLVEGISYYS
jgi:hypothetical protein